MSIYIIYNLNIDMMHMAYGELKFIHGEPMGGSDK